MKKLSHSPRTLQVLGRLNKQVIHSNRKKNTKMRNNYRTRGQTHFKSMACRWHRSSNDNDDYCIGNGKIVNPVKNSEPDNEYWDNYGDKVIDGGLQSEINLRTCSDKRDKRDHTTDYWMSHQEVGEKYDCSDQIMGLKSHKSQQNNKNKWKQELSNETRQNLECMKINNIAERIRCLQGVTKSKKKSNLSSRSERGSKSRSRSGSRSRSRSGSRSRSRSGSRSRSRRGSRSRSRRGSIIRTT